MFEGPNTKQVLNFGDFFTVKTATTAEQRIVEVGDVWSLAWDTDGNIRQVISLTDAFEIITTTEEGKLTVNAGDIFTFEKDASGEGAAKRQIKIGDYFEVNFEGFFTESVKLGDYVTFENFEINVAETFKLVGKLTLAGIIGVTPLDELITVASFIWPKIPAPEWLETLASTLGLSSSDPEPSAAAAQAADARTDNSTSGFLGTGIGAVDDTARAAAAAADQVLLQSQFNNNPIQIPVEYVPSNTIEGGINPFGDSSFGAGQSPGLTINQPVEIPAVYTFPETIGENAGPFAEGYVFPATADPASIQSSITGAISAIEPLQPMAIADVTGVQFQTDQFTDTYSVTARATGVSWGKFTNNYAASATVTSLDKGDYSPSYTGTVTITTVIGDTGPGGGPGFAAENYRGTSYLTNEFTTIAEKGRELFRTPDGITGMANSPALARLPIGTRIWSNPDTERILRSVSAARATPSVSATVDYAQLASVALELANLADSPDIAVSVSNSHDVEMLVSRMESMRMARL